MSKTLFKNSVSFSSWLHDESTELGSSLEIDADSSLAYRVLFPLLKSHRDVVWILPSGASFVRFVNLIRKNGSELADQFFFAAPDAGQVLLGLQQAIRNNAGTIVLDMTDGFAGEQYQLLAALRRIAQGGLRVIVIRPLSEMETPTAMQSRIAILPHQSWLFDGHLFVTLKARGIPVLRKLKVADLPDFTQPKKTVRSFFSIAEREALASA